MRIIIKSAAELLRNRGLQEGGKVQKFIDSECIRLMDKYTPMRTGYLKKSVTLGSKIGSGKLRYSAPYAKQNYYYNAGRGIEGTARGGLRGRNWFERMKAAHRAQILDGARKIAGAKRR